MKKLIYIIMGLGLLFTACSPMDDIYADIDAQETAIEGQAEYTLTDEDYADLKLNGGFESVDDVKTMIPSFLTGLYPVWGKGSSVLVNYNMIGGLTDLGEVNGYVNAENYTLNIDDYATSGSDVLGFYPDDKPSDFLDDVLAANIDAIEGDIVLVKYTQYTEEPVITITTNFSLEENFDYGTVSGNLTTITTEWTGHSGTNPYVGYDATTSLSMADYPTSDIGGSVTIANPGGEDVNREFTPITSGIAYASTLVNFSAVATGDYFFHFREEGGSFLARVGAKDDGSGKILFGIGASSSTLTYGSTSFDLDTTYLLVASYDIATGVSNLYVLTTAEATEPATPEATNTGNANAVVSIAIRQDYSDGPTGTLDGIRVANSWEGIMVNDVAVDVQGEKTYKEVYYKFDGEYWNPSNGVYYLSSDDYDSMGTASGQPGRYNNFDSNVAPANYLPAFLALAHPFAQEEDALIVMYKYRYDGQTITRGNLYTVIDGVWAAHSSSLQFGHNGNSWLPDNTIKYTFTSNDVAFISNAFIVTYPGPADNVGFFGSFDRRSSSNNYWSDDMLLEAFNALLNNKNPSAEEGQKYTLTFIIYNGSTTNETKSVIKTDGVWVYQ